MGYSQWVRIRITNELVDNTVTINDIETLFGKFYDGPDDKDEELRAANFIKKTLGPQESMDIYLCGRDDKASGTEGNLTLVDREDHEIANIYWNCPFIGANEFKATRENNDYTITLSSPPDSGCLGEQTVTIAPK